MSQLGRPRVSQWTRLRSFAVGKYKTVQLSIERRAFERKLERIVRAALAHQSGELPTGHPQYKLLRQQADSTCAKFAHGWNITPDLIEAQIPAIRKLKSLADPAPKLEPAVLVSLGVASAVALFFLVGVPAGLTSIREAGQAYVSNGHTIHLGPYALDRIEPDGTVKAGCHVISWEEMSA